MTLDPVPPPPPELAPDAHKGDAGRVLALCGSPTMPGAAILVARAAARAGAGLVAVGVVERAMIQALAPAVPEATYVDLTDVRFDEAQLPDKITARSDDVRIAGPGLGASERTRALVLALARDPSSVPLVLDADALNVVAGHPERLRRTGAPVVLTPHPGEAGRLLDARVPSAAEGRRRVAAELAERTAGIVVLKGHDTIVAGGGRAWTCSTGNPGMATAGAGDVLAGILAAYLVAFRGKREVAQDAAFEATRAAVHVHGLAGDLAARALGRRAVVASDLVEFLAAAQQAHAAR